MISLWEIIIGLCPIMVAHSAPIISDKNVVFVRREIMISVSFPREKIREIIIELCSIMIF